MRRFCALISLAFVLGLNSGELLAQDSNPAPAPRQRPKPAETTPPSQNPGDTKDQPPPADTNPSDKPSDGKPSAKQPSKPGSKPGTKAKTPTQPSAPARPVIQVADVQCVEPGPFVRREKPRDWLFTVNVDVRSSRSDLPDPRNPDLPDTRSFRFDTLSVVFPLLPPTASAVPDRSTLKTTLRLQNIPVAGQKTSVLDKQITGQPYQSGVSLVKIAAENGECREISFEVSYKTTSYNTVYDEAAATNVKWPENGWPVVAASTFGPQMFIDYAMFREQGSGVMRREFSTEALQHWINEQTNGNPKGVPPATLAKWLAGQMMARLQPTGEGLTFLNTGQLQGIGTLGPEVTFKNARGSDFDIAATLVAAYRLAGLPARLVIGWDTGTGSDKGEDFLGKARGAKEGLRPWAEWALYDEAKATLNWVPVDLAKMRKQGSRAQPMDRAWKYFGTHEELQGVVPIAFHFHPPTTVESYGSPAMWGWMMTPDHLGVGYQALRFRADRPSTTSDEQKKKREKKE